MKNISATPIDFDETRLTSALCAAMPPAPRRGAVWGFPSRRALRKYRAGTFGIQVDGDLFKAIVSIPLWEEDEEEENEVDTL